MEVEHNEVEGVRRGSAAKRYRVPILGTVSDSLPELVTR